MVSVELQVEGVDLDDEATVEVIGEHFADGLWGSVDGLVTVTVFPGARLVDEVVDVARRIESRISGSKVRRVHRDLVSASDIASRVGVSREAVRKWSRRSTSERRLFPAPYATVGGEGKPSRLWLWPDIAGWMKSVLAIDMGEEFLNDATVAQIDGCLARVPDHTTASWHAVQSGTYVHTADLLVVGHVVTNAKLWSGYGVIRAGEIRPALHSSFPMKSEHADNLGASVSA